MPAGGRVSRRSGGEVRVGKGVRVGVGRAQAEGQSAGLVWRR